MKYNLKKISDNSGFTIVELLIATTILSTILVIATIVMVGIGNLYYKGVNQARVQGNVRDLSNEIAQQLQLGFGNKFTSIAPFTDDPTDPVGRVCIGPTRYSYVLNKQIGAQDIATHETIQHVLWRDKVTEGTCGRLTNFWKTEDVTTLAGYDGSDGTELIAPHSRLTTFSITRAAPEQPYNIKIGVAYGDGDLLCNETVAGDCASNVDETNVAHHNALQHLTNPQDIICRGRLGDHFCAASSLQTTVVKRLIKQGD